MISIELLGARSDLIRTVAELHTHVWPRFGPIEDRECLIRSRVGKVSSVPQTFVAIGRDGQIRGFVCMLSECMGLPLEFSPWLASLFVLPIANYIF